MSLKKKKKKIEMLFNRIKREYGLIGLSLDWGDAYSIYATYNHTNEIIRLSQIILKQVKYEEFLVHLLYQLSVLYDLLKGNPEKNPIAMLYIKNKNNLTSRTKLLTRYEAVCPSCGAIHKKNRINKLQSICGVCLSPNHKSSLIFKRTN